MRWVLVTIAALAASPALSQGGFFGGMSQGMDEARSQRLYGGSPGYEQYREQRRMRELMEETRRLNEENNRMLRDQEWERQFRLK